MIAACYDSFIISRRVIPRNPAPQFIHRDVRFFIDVTLKRKGRRGVNELHEGADTASSKRIMPAQQFSLRHSDDFRRSPNPPNHCCFAEPLGTYERVISSPLMLRMRYFDVVYPMVFYECKDYFSYNYFFFLRINA